MLLLLQDLYIALRKKKTTLSMIGGGLIIGVTEENVNTFAVSLNVNPYI